MTMIEAAVFDAKPYDREYLAQAAGAERVAWRFHDFRLSTAHQAFLTHEALSDIARVTTENLLNSETGAPFLEGTLL